jgi:hypothetical protein
VGKPADGARPRPDLHAEPGELYYKAGSKSMGKRELLLIVMFVIMGTVVYQFTAPQPAPGERSFSLSRIIESMRREVRGNRASAEVTTATTHAVDAAVTELRVVLRGEVTLTGEDRKDISAELRVHSSGYDDAEAHRLATESVLSVDRAGGRMIVSVKFPRVGVQRGRLVLKVPARLETAYDATSGRLEIAGVAAVDLLNSRGDAQIRNITGRVGGAHRGGTIVITDTGPVKLSAVGSDVRLERIRGEVTLNTRSGEVKGRELAGPIDIDANGTDVELDKFEKTTGILRIKAQDGSIAIEGLRTEGRIDVRGADVDVTVDRAAPLAIYSDGGDTVEITPPAGGYQLDAVASHSTVTVANETVPVVTNGQEQRATGPVNGGGPTITIRSGRGSITVRAR